MGQHITIMQHYKPSRNGFNRQYDQRCTNQRTCEGDKGTTVHDRHICDAWFELKSLQGSTFFYLGDDLNKSARVYSGL